MDTIMSDIIPSIEDDASLKDFRSDLRKAARFGLAEAMDDIVENVDDIIEVSRPTDGDPGLESRWEALNQNVKTDLENHFRTRIYNHIDSLSGHAFSQNPIAPDKVGGWKIELTTAKDLVVGSVVSLSAILTSQNQPDFGDLVGISATVTVSPDFETISILPDVQSQVEVYDITHLMPYAGPERPGLRDDREGSSETVLVDDFDAQYQQCTKVILDDILALAAQAGDHRAEFEHDHRELTERLSELGMTLRKDIKSNPDLQSLLTDDLSKWKLSLRTIPVDDAEYGDQEMLDPDEPLGTLELLDDIALRRKQFEMTGSGIPLLNSLFHRKIDHIPTEELADQWVSFQRSRELFDWI